MISNDWVPQGPRSDRIAAANPQIRSKRRARSLSILAFRIAAAASTCFATPGAAASAGTSPSPAADLRLMTLIEAHSEAQDVATEVLAKAFSTVLQARRACDQGQVDAGIELYESIPFGPVPKL